MRQVAAITQCNFTGHFRVLLILLLLATVSTAEAKIYRCTDASGNVSYSESACKQADRSNNSRVGSAADQGAKNDTVICKQVAKMAKSLYPSIRGQRDITHVYNKLGGRDSLSSATTQIVNYMTSFRYNHSVSTSRVVELTKKRCLRGSFGKIESNDLPERYRPYSKSSGSGISQDMISNHRDKQERLREKAKQSHLRQVEMICQKYNKMLDIYDARLEKPMDEIDRVKLEAEREMTQSVHDENCTNTEK